MEMEVENAKKRIKRKKINDRRTTNIYNNSICIICIYFLSINKEK